MISIQKYLKGQNGAALGDADSANAVFLSVSLSLLESIATHVLAGESAQPLRSEIEQLTATLQPNIEIARAVQFQDSARRILSAYGETIGETAHRATEEMQHIVGTLSQALSLVANGGERSVSRLQKIQESLQRTSMIQEVGELRASLSQAIRLIKEESVREKEMRARDMAALQAEVTKVRGFAAATPGKKLPGRPEGVREISAALEALNPQEPVYIAVFVFDNLKAIIQRFGPEVVDELIALIIKERIHPVAPEKTVFRWTPYSLVGLFNSTLELPQLKFKIAELNRGPLVHRLELGNRTAVVKLALSHLVAKGSKRGQDVLIGEVDRFTGWTP